MTRRRGLIVAVLVLLLGGIFPGAGRGEELPPPGQPLTLEQVKDIALKYHPSLRASLATVEASKARVEQALAAYYPQVNFNASYNASTFNFSPVAGSIRPPTYNWTFLDVFSTGPALSQTIYDFGRTANTVRVNRENTQASEQDLATARLTVALNVKQAYFGVLQTQRLIQVAQEVVSQTRQHLEQAQGFYQAGIRPKIDVTKAEVDLANAELALIQARNNYQVARVNLNNAMGLQESLNFPIEDILGFSPRPITLEEIITTAHAQRPELLQLKARQRGQEATIKLAQSNYYPVLSGNASYLLRSHHIDTHLFWDATLGAVLSFPLFSGFSTSAQVAEARANLRNLQAQEENQRLSIRLEGEQAFLGLKVGEEQTRVAEKAVAQAQENFELARGRYQVGVGSPLEVTDAEVSLANARANYINALYNYRVAEARIDRAMGLNR